LDISDGAQYIAHQTDFAHQTAQLRVTERYKNKYRIKSARHPAWDYGWNGAYFVTICTKNRIRWFGDVVLETQNFASLKHMRLSDIGKIADRCWLEIPEHFPFVNLGKHIVMPDHVHGIVIINKSDGCNASHNHHMDDYHTTATEETQYIASLWQTSLRSLPPTSGTQNQFGPQSKNLASIIRGFKAGVTKHARLINPKFAWQARYHDHIIRNKRAFRAISNYIVANPSKWGKVR
jgi:REP element-mobilizing transposase RayT